jgi:hypothetical protein
MLQRIQKMWCFVFHRAYWRTRHGIYRECIKCETLTIGAPTI